MSLRDKLKILVVDDMAVSRGLLTQALDQLNIKNYDYVSNGQEAVEYLSKSPVHLVISDYNMPQMDGLGLLKACLLYTSPSPRDRTRSRMPSSA